MLQSIKGSKGRSLSAMIPHRKDAITQRMTQRENPNPEIAISSREIKINIRQGRQSISDGDREHAKTNKLNIMLHQQAEKQVLNPKKIKQLFANVASNRIKIVHGKVIRQYVLEKKEKGRFFMLDCNQQMYADSVRKFRKYSLLNVKAPKRELCNRSLDQIWKVLKLQSVLKQQPKTLHLDGLKYFNAHLRLRNQVRANKSYRPTTNSSNCKLKIDYVNYLQELNVKH